MSLKILRAGVFTTLQDQGRPGMRHLGVPESGAADRLSLMLANRCVGKRAGALALEATLLGPKIEFTSPCGFAICGAAAEITLNGKPILANMGHLASAGDVLDVGAITGGARCYIALSQDISAKRFGSAQSTYSYARLGGHEGRALQNGDTLSFAKDTQRTLSSLSAGFAPRYTGTLILRVLEGPEFGALKAACAPLLFGRAFTASALTDRMGARLTGPKLGLKSKREMVSSALLPGTLQLPQSGEPILSLVDSHCTGGYARIACVISADLHLAGQIAPGTQIYFRKSSEADAKEALMRLTATYGKFE